MKVLVIRFSAFGDLLQSLSIPGHIKNHWKDAEIHFLTRADFADMVRDHPSVDHVWTLEKKKGFLGLIGLILQLRKEPWTHIYDAHGSLRSKIVSAALAGPFGLLGRLFGVRLLRRSIPRFKRFLLFQFRINWFEMPFSGQRDLLKPLEKWGIPFSLPATPQLFMKTKQMDEKSLMTPEKFVALAPSSAHRLKRWPLDHFKSLIQQLPDHEFVCLGGPEDTFIEELVKVDPSRVINFAGKLSLKESAGVVLKSQVLVSNDTGLMHVAEQTGHPCVALMGPAPFGFPSRPTTKIMELNLRCRPCSKHGQKPCVNKDQHHQCMVGIKPESVAKEVLLKIGGDAHA